MKKILFYSDTHQLGGTEQQMYLLAKFLPKNKYSMSLACSKDHSLNSWCSKFIDIGVEVIRLDVIHKHDPRHYFELRKIIPLFDLIHIHLWNPASCRYAFLAAKDKPIITTEHDPFALSNIKTWIKLKLHKNVKKIIAASKFASETVTKHFPTLKNRLIYIPHGIDVKAWALASTLPDRDEFRKKAFNAKQKDKVILCVAELHERKGQKTLIQAIKDIEETNKNLILVFVGKGPNESCIRQISEQLKSRVIFLGFRDDIAALMRAADFFVLPSQREAFGLVILEAGISEIPVIASNVGGIREIVQKDKNGFLFEPNDSASLSLALNDAISNSWDCHKFVINMRHNIEENYNASLMAERTAQIYDEVIGQ